MMQMEKLVKECDMELMKMAMLKHEETFRQQVHDLHRLYSIQKQLMSDLTGPSELSFRRQRRGKPRWELKRAAPHRRGHCCRRWQRLGSDAFGGQGRRAGADAGRRRQRQPEEAARAHPLGVGLLPREPDDDVVDRLQHRRAPACAQAGPLEGNGV